MAIIIVMNGLPFVQILYGNVNHCIRLLNQTIIINGLNEGQMFKVPKVLHLKITFQNERSDGPVMHVAPSAVCKQCIPKHVVYYAQHFELKQEIHETRM